MGLCVVPGMWWYLEGHTWEVVEARYIFLKLESSVHIIHCFGFFCAVWMILKIEESIGAQRYISTHVFVLACQIHSVEIYVLPVDISYSANYFNFVYKTRHCQFFSVYL